MNLGERSPEEWVRQLAAWRALPAETEWLEFKSATESFGHEDFGRYVSALANEARLAGRAEAWLVFGVGNRIDAGTGLRPVVGSRFGLSLAQRNEIKRRIAEGTSPTISLAEPVELQLVEDAPERRVLLWRVPAAPVGMPVAWKGHFHGRDGESLGALALHELDALRAQPGASDWTAVSCGSDLALLDPAALARARELYARRHAAHPQALEALSRWDDRELLHHLRLARDGDITRAGLLLLGRPESVALLGGPRPVLTWVLLDHAGEAATPRHFELPLLLALDALVACVRLVEVPLLPPGQLAPLNLPNYDTWVLREALHNAVVHQDFALGGRVRVTESPDSLCFDNLGRFLPGSVERVLSGEQPELRYRNPCLAHAMVELDLIETINSGVPKMFRVQRQRFFPLPDYQLGDEPPSVRVRVFGKVLDANYVRALMADPGITLAEAVLLDRVQKRQAISAADAKGLRARGLVEGRLSRLSVSAGVAALTGQEVAYVEQRGLDDEHFRALVLKLLSTGPQPRSKIDRLLLPKLPGQLSTEVLRKDHVRKLLKQMTKAGLIRNIGKPTKGALWALVP